MARARQSDFDVIGHEDGLQEMAQLLCEREPSFLPAIERVGRIPLRTMPRGFPGLVRIIIGQQVSTSAARTIFTRLEEGLPNLSPLLLERMDPEDLRPFGLSGPKIRAIKALSSHMASGRLEPARLETMGNDDVVAALTEVPGIGPWTAEIYLLFSLQRADVWPAKDLALQKALFELKSMRKMPSADRTTTLARRWRPMRGVAAHLLWAYYNHGRSAPVAARPSEAMRGRTEHTE